MLRIKTVSIALIVSLICGMFLFIGTQNANAKVCNHKHGTYLSYKGPVRGKLFHHYKKWICKDCHKVVRSTTEKCSKKNAWTDFRMIDNKKYHLKEWHCAKCNNVVKGKKELHAKHKFEREYIARGKVFYHTVKKRCKGCREIYNSKAEKCVVDYYYPKYTSKNHYGYKFCIHCSHKTSVKGPHTFKNISRNEKQCTKCYYTIER